MLKPSCEYDPLENPRGFRKSLARWFARHGRDYPWRRTSDPYEILVSEVMLQQTQIATVLGRGFYTRFLERFPDTQALAQADDDSLLKAWEGLGYYRRARMLREAARWIESKHHGNFPTKLDDILALPGVGRYTAGAVYSFAFKGAAPIVDGNISRTLSRLMDCHEQIDQSATIKQLWAWAELLLDQESPHIHNSALMELGQTLCRPGLPDCMACPVSEYCKTRNPEILPQKARRPQIIPISEDVVLATCGASVLLRKLAEGRRQGMWRLPARDGAEEWPVLLERKYTITRYRVTLRVRKPPSPLRAALDESWHSLDELSKLAIPPADRKALHSLLGMEEEIA